MKKRKMVIAIISLSIILVLGIAYAWFSFYQEGVNRKLVGGDIYLSLTDGTETINLQNVFPETAQEARDVTRHVAGTATNNTLTFTVEGENNSEKTIYYEILLNYGDELESTYKRFYDRHIVFDLIEIGANNEETYLVNAQSFENFNRTRIWVDSIAANGGTIDKTYKLRMWLIIMQVLKLVYMETLNLRVIPNYMILLLVTL